MRQLNLSRSAAKSLRRLHGKHARQLAQKLQALVADPRPNDSKKLVGWAYFRVDVGEYRIVYMFDATVIDVLLVERRDRVYRILDR